MAKSPTRTKKRIPSPRADAVTLRIELHGSEPPIWRRVIVKRDSTLKQLHEVFQAAMGWLECHFHRFEIGGRTYVSKHEEAWGEPDEQNLRDAEHTLGQALGDPPVREFFYIYDYGDNWEHHVVVEEIGEIVEWMSYPVCTGGERACPPEDVGALEGYYHLLSLLRDKSSPERTEMLTWLGGHFDPDSFDPNRVNRELRYLIPLLREAKGARQKARRGSTRTATHRRKTKSNPETFTETQGQYLAFIWTYSKLHGRAPAEADMQQYFRTTPPSVHQMVLKLEKLGFIRRTPRVARSIELLVPPEELPMLE